MPVPLFRIVVLNISEHVVHLVWCGQDGRSDGYGSLLLAGGLLLVQIIVLHLLKNNCKLGEGYLEVLGVHGFLHEHEL